jgi:hypothetical protein
MAFVQTKFALPTVTRPDGTLGAYVEYNSNPRGDRYIWPAEQIAIYQAQLAAKLAALKKQRTFSLLKPAVQSSAKLGVVTFPSGAAGEVNKAVWDAGPNAAVSDAILQFLANRNSNSGQAQPSGNDPNSPASIIPGVPNSALYIGGSLAAAALVIALAKGGRK